MANRYSSSTTASPARCLFVTLGCAKNEVDTDSMRSLLLAAGYEEARDVDEADVALVNTCSFLAEATSESIETTLQLADEVQHGVREVPIIMCGCVPSRYGFDVEKELPEVAAFVKVEEERNIVQVVSSVLRRNEVEPPVDKLVLRTVEGSVSYVKISDGCDRFCTFCAIPYIRGRYHSRAAEDIVDEARALAEGGSREIVLIGQDTGVWGSDFTRPDTLAALIRRVAQAVEPYGCWVRVLYLQPEGMTDELIDTLAHTKGVLPYIDIPIQHCSRSVLQRMGREGDAQSLRELFSRLRRDVPGIVLRTTAMAGFPGETEEEAQELLDFIEEVGFDYVSVFAYSAEEGTAAAELDGQVDDDTKTERTQRLMDTAERLGFAATARHIGQVVDVIVDGIEEGDYGEELIGHAWFQAPDCDGAVHLELDEACVGDIVQCQLQDSFCYELTGVPVGEGQRDEVRGN